HEDEQLVFVVADQGMGIPPERQAAIFESFVQVDSSTTRKFGGSGLGLTISKQIVDLMSGTISIDSAPGQGCSISVRIPYTPVADNGGGAAEDPEAALEFASDSLVLVVEDNLMNQEMIRAVFEDLGITIHLAGDGATGVQMACQLCPELILMDLHMPDMDGFQTTEAIRKCGIRPDPPIVMLSADAFTDRRERARALGIMDYLTKPLDLDRLLRILKKHLRYKVL
ncbi:MAG: response regulator, partial [Xanthomonadales bacterium]|nr:response regulator [Xanthomonadales bacterium]